MKPSASLELQRQTVRAAALRYQTTHPRVFGPVVRGDDADARRFALQVPGSGVV